jgi:hypothetical protein
VTTVDPPTMGAAETGAARPTNSIVAAVALLARCVNAFNGVLLGDALVAIDCCRSC